MFLTNIVYIIVTIYGSREHLVSLISARGQSLYGVSVA